MVIRIFGDKGLIEQGESSADLITDKPDGEKCKVLAAKLLLHALRYADYENIRKDPTRRVLPIFTDHSLVNFWGYARDLDGKGQRRSPGFRPNNMIPVRLQKILDEEVAKNVMRGMAGVSVKVLSRMFDLTKATDTNSGNISVTERRAERTA